MRHRWHVIHNITFKNEVNGLSYNIFHIILNDRIIMHAIKGLGR